MAKTKSKKSTPCKTSLKTDTLFTKMFFKYLPIPLFQPLIYLIWLGLCGNCLDSYLPQ